MLVYLGFHFDRPNREFELFKLCYQITELGVRILFRRAASVTFILSLPIVFLFQPTLTDHMIIELAIGVFSIETFARIRVSFLRV